MIQSSQYLKQQVSTSIEDSIAQLKDQISIDLLNFELGIVSSRKLLSEDVRYIQDSIDGLAVDIDIAINECFKNCIQQIEEIIDQADLKSKLEIG